MQRTYPKYNHSAKIFRAKKVTCQLPEDLPDLLSELVNSLRGSFQQVPPFCKRGAILEFKRAIY